MATLQPTMIPRGEQRVDQSDSCVIHAEPTGLLMVKSTGFGLMTDDWLVQIKVQ